MVKDIRSYYRTYHLCQVCKTDTSKKPGCLQPIPILFCPFYTICVDFIVGLPMAPGGLNSIAIVTDKFSKAVRLLPCKKFAALGEAFAKRFFHHIYPVWGAPNRLISDRDRPFVSTFWSTLTRLAGTKIALTTAYHPQADGQAKRTNRTIESIIRILCLEASSHSWAVFLPNIELLIYWIFTLSPPIYSPPVPYDDQALPFLDISLAGEDMASSLLECRKIAGELMLRAQASNLLNLSYLRPAYLLRPPVPPRTLVI